VVAIGQRWLQSDFQRAAGNLTRAKAAALEWAERKTVTEDRKLPVARRLKSLDNFWWSSSPMRYFAEAAE
jgi:hypothetical protein